MGWGFKILGMVKDAFFLIYFCSQKLFYKQNISFLTEIKLYYKFQRQINKKSLLQLANYTKKSV